MERLAKIVPDVYASKAQLRTPDHMSKQNRYSPEVRERAVRLVMEHKGEHDSQWAAIESIAGKIGCTAETLRGWVRQGERDQGKRAGEIPSRPSPAIEENATLLAAWRESLEINP